MSYPAPAPYQPYEQPSYGMPPGPTPKPGAGLAIAAMVLGIVALLLSWVPIINNLAAVLALVGLGLGIPALIRARRGTGGGSGLAITGLVTSVLALVIVVLTQLFFLEVVDEVGKGIQEGMNAPVAPATPPAGTEETAEVQAAGASDTVPLGVPAQVGDYQVTVDSVTLDGNAIVASGNSYNPAPTGQYVVVQLTATYLGTEEGQPGWELSAVFHGSDARQYSDSECGAVLPDSAMDAPTLNSGGTDTFQFCMDVPAAAIPGGQLSVEPLISFEDDARVYFALQ